MRRFAGFLSLAALAAALSLCAMAPGEDTREGEDARQKTENAATVSPRVTKKPATMIPSVADLPRQPSIGKWVYESNSQSIDFNPFATTQSPARQFLSTPQLEPQLFGGSAFAVRVMPPRSPIISAPTVRLADDSTGSPTPTVATSNSDPPVASVDSARIAAATSSNQPEPSNRPAPLVSSVISLQPPLDPPSPSTDEQLWLADPFQIGGGIFLDHGVFRTALQQPLAPLQPLQPAQPPAITPYEPSIPNAFDTSTTTSIAELAAAVGGGPVQGVGQSQAQAIAPTDLGGLLQSANSIQSVNTTRRSPVALSPNIRGHEFADIYAQANGAYWFPVREDLDSMLSKIDPGMIQDVIVIPGPYGLRYGPGIDFIDIITADTPRFDDGYQTDYRANGNIRTNGGQLYGRLTADGGDADYGYRVSYGHRKGSDYDAGSGLQIPSSYDNGDVWAQFGFNTTKYQKVEASYLRMDQGPTEYAAQFFDVDSETTDGVTLKATDEDPSSPWSQFVLEGWWNRTFFNGSITPNKSNPNFPVITRVEFALDQEVGGMNTIAGNTLGSNVASGSRAVVRYGDLDDRFLRLGADLHYMEQGLRENYDITNTVPPSIGPFFTNQPFSTGRDEGLFAEYCIPVVDGWKATLGGRVDWVETEALLRDVRPDTNLDVDELTQHDDLYSYYLTNELKLNDQWTVNLGYGYAQRPPALVERYADGVFLGLLQSGFTRVIGDPALRPERDFQIDAGITCKYDNFRANGTYFYSWVVD
ncbi:MAG TPA: TonB-dependent receptor, partial [Pirellulales bacterium]